MRKIGEKGGKEQSATGQLQFPFRGLARAALWDSVILSGFGFIQEEPVALLVESPLAARLHLEGPNATLAGALSAAAAAHPFSSGHVANRCAEEPDAIISHVRLRGSHGE